MGKVVHVYIGFGVMLLIVVLTLVTIGFVNSELFHEILRKLKEIIEALSPLR